jgi:DNA invertase Pin-like site-specific DNA recombinase
VQISKVLHNRGSGRNQSLRLCVIHAQNDGAVTQSRGHAIYFGLIEQLIYEYVRSKYDLRICEGEHRRPNLRRPVRRATQGGRRKGLQRENLRRSTDRPALAKAIGALGNGDTLIVTKLDRLARSTRDLLNTLAAIGDKGASFKSLGDSWADTTTPAGKLMLTVLGGLAEYERHLILTRTREGRQRAQQRGVRFGRRPKLTAHQQREALARRAAGEALVDIARSYAVSHSTISRL